jgi:hypothetical protein
VVEQGPPPIPLPPAGYFWRTLACLADIIPLLFLGVMIAGLTAGPDELAAKAKVAQFEQRFVAQYTKAITHPSEHEQKVLMDMILKPDEKDLDAVSVWYTHQGEVCFFVMLVALMLQEAFWSGQTIGKKIFNLRTVDYYTQEPPRIMSCILRSAWKSSFIALANPFTALLGIINFHVPLFRKDSRAWHDMFTRTYVVDNKNIKKVSL